MDTVFIGNIILLIILTLSILSRNNSLSIALTVLLFLSLASQIGGSFQKISLYLLEKIDKYGLKVGIIILMMGVMAPLTTREIVLKELLDQLKGIEGIVGVLAGIIVAVLAGKGASLLQNDPKMILILVFGTILGILIFKGYPVGPLVGSGIVALVFKIINIFK